MMLGLKSFLSATLVGLGCCGATCAQSPNPVRQDLQLQPAISHVQLAQRPGSRTVSVQEPSDRVPLEFDGTSNITTPNPSMPSLLSEDVMIESNSESTEGTTTSVSPLGQVLGLGTCCNDAPWPGYGVTYITGQVPYQLFNVGGGAVLGRDQQTTSILPLRVGASPTQVLLPFPGDNGPLGAVRITDNNSAIPRDRLFIDYSAFNNIDASRQYDSHRATIGLEKRFVDPIYGIASSIDFRLPVGMTLAPGSEFGPNTDSTSSELGNLMFGLKSQLWSGPGYAMSIGMAATIPTADDFSLREPGLPATVLIENKTVHITPYLAATWTPAPYTSAHIFYSIDFDATGSPVFLDTNLNGTFDVRRRLNSTTMHNLDLSFVSWLFRDDFAPTGFSGAAWYAEYHYSGSLETPDSVVAGNLRVGNSANAINIQNVAFGGHFQFANDKLLTVGYTLPVDKDAVFDGEFRLIFNKYF